jgi:uncharacterized HAD superfamily protein
VKSDLHIFYNIRRFIFQMKRLVIGLDIDGVIVDAAGAMLPLLAEICNRPLSHQDIYCYDFAEALNMDREAVRYVWQKTIENELLLNASPITGAIDGLAALAWHEIWLVTARPAFLQHLTESWLDERMIRYDGIVFDRGGEKHSAGPKYDVFVEDFIEEASLIANAGILTLLFNQPWNQVDVLPDNCHRVHDWGTVVSIINKLERGL